MKEQLAIIGLINPKSPENVGAVMRAVGCYQADEVLYTGTRYDRAAKFTTDTKSVAEQVPMRGVGSIFDEIPDDVTVVCVELALGATPLPHFAHPDKAVYIFGPEDGTIPQEVADRAHHVVYVPTIGCMNLAASVNVLLYDRLSKSDAMVTGDELIRSSRDNRNKLKVRQVTEA